MMRPTNSDLTFQYPLSIMGIASVQKVSKTITNIPTPHLNALRFRANIYRKSSSTLLSTTYL